MAVKKRTGLGRGLDALIAPQKSADQENVSESEEKESDKKKKNNKTSKTGSKKNDKQNAINDTGSTEDQANEDNVKVVEKIVNVPVEKVVEVPVEKIVEKVVEVPSKGGTLMVKIDEIEPNNEQPRKDFSEETLQELANSIKEHGLIQPLVVVKDNKFYKIIAGERRWRAARIAGLSEVPVIVKDYSPQEAVEIALIENIQRDDLNPIEEADAFRRLIEEYGLTQEEAAQRVSKSRTSVTNSLRLLKLDEKVRQMVIENMISAGHARALLSIEDPETQYQIAMKIFDEKLSVRETEKIIKNLLKPHKEKTSPDPQLMAAYHELEERVTSALGSKVSINPGKRKKGKIEIEYYSEEDLDRLVNMLTSIRS